MSLNIHDFPPILKKEEAEALWRAGKKNEVIEGNLQLVALLAGKYAGPVPYDDLFQEGCVGLMMAAKNYDPDMGASFYTHARLYIKGRICDGLNKDMGRGFVPRYANEESRRIKKIQAEYQKQTGKEISIEELSQKTNIPTHRIKNLQDALASPFRSLNEPVADIGDEPEELGDFIPNPVDLEETVCTHIMAEQAVEVIEKTLSEEQKAVVFEMINGSSIQTVCKRHRLTCAEAQRIYITAIQTIQEHMGLPIVVPEIRTEDTRAEDMFQFIKHNHRKFGGRMTGKEIAAYFGVTTFTISRYVEKVKENKPLKFYAAAKEKRDFIRNYYTTMTTKEMAEKLGITETYVYRIKSDLGLSSQQQELAEQRRNFVRENVSTMTVKELAERLGVTKASIHRYKRELSE